MSNQFEEKLKQRIHDVFDNYEDDSADLGWKELRKKYPPQKNRKPLLWWLSSAAAVFIVATGLWLISNTNTQSQKTQLTKVKPVTGQSPQTTETPSASSAENKTEASSPAIRQNQQQLAGQAKKDTKVHGETAGQKLPVTLIKAEENKTVLSRLADNSSKIADTQTKNSSEISAPGNNTSSYTFTPENQNTAQPQEPAYKKSSLLALNPKNANKQKEKQDNKKVSFGVFAGSFINYAEGSENKLNLGAGFTSEIKLTKRLNLVTGVSLAQNTLSFQKNEVPQAAAVSFDAIQNNKSYTLSAMRVISYNLDRYEADLLGLDIPIDLKYTFNQQKNLFYMAAGVSSGTFLNEAYTYRYSSTGPTGTVLASPENYNKIEKGSSGFEFARMLNVSLGVGYPIGKKSTLIVEPFMNYPLKTIGDEDIRFGSGGLNLKFNFSSLK